jgi:hypothetical protein
MKSGLNPYIERCRTQSSRRWFYLAPDALSPLGGYPGMMMQIEYKKRTREEMLEDFIAAYT